MRTLKVNMTVNVPDGGICNFLDPHFNVSKQVCRFCVSNKGTKHCALFNMMPLTTCGTEVYKCENCMTSKFIDEEAPPQLDVKLLVNDVLKDVVRIKKQASNSGLPEDLAMHQAVSFVKNKFK